MRVGIIGCGKIAEKRAKFIDFSGCYDINPETAYFFSKKINCINFSSPDKLIEDSDVVVVSTTNDALCSNAIKAINAKKHVLIEKPAGINSSEINKMIYLSVSNGVFVKVGFNHRYHPAILKAYDIIKEGTIGELMFIRANYGHGGRLGYNTEWRSKYATGGGELLDQGVHLIDLSNFFFGQDKLKKAIGFTKNYFWDMEVEDNGFMILESGKGKTAILNVSCTEWKNTFSFDIYGKIGKISINGLGGSYGKEKLTLYKMKPEMGIPDTEIFEFPEEDASWLLEWQDFTYCIRNNIQPRAGLKEALTAMYVVEEIRKAKI